MRWFIIIQSKTFICYKCIFVYSIQHFNDIAHMIDSKLRMFNAKHPKHYKVVDELLRRSMSIKKQIKATYFTKFITQSLHQLTTDCKKIAKLKYEVIYGLTKKQINNVCKELIKNVKQDACPVTKIAHYKIYNKLVIFDTKKISFPKKIAKCLLCLLLKWKMNTGNRLLTELVKTARYTFEQHVHQCTVLLPKFYEKYLINTYEKLCKDKNDLYNMLLGAPVTTPVIIGDGVRFKAAKPSNFHASYKMFDNKHKYHSYNSLGFCSISGKYCGFWPVEGTNSDGAHSDGRIIDWLVLNSDTKVVPQLFKTNSSLHSNDGTLLIFDRALAYGSFCYNHGILNIHIPCPDNGMLSTYEADKTRYSTTSVRWQIEKCYSTIGQRWAIFKSATAAISGWYVKLFGHWLNFAAALCNKFEIGLHKFDTQRMKETKWMICRKKSIWFAPSDKTYLQLLLDEVKFQKDIKKKWYCAPDIDSLIQNSHWTLSQLKNNFEMNYDETRLLCAGVFGVDQAKEYLIHSRHYLKVFYSNVPEYKNILLIYGFKKKLTRIYQTTNTKSSKRGDHVFHSVLLSTRSVPIVNIFQDEYFSPKNALIDFACTCVCGQRQITADTHVVAAITYLSQYYFLKKYIEVPKSDKKYNELVDVHGFIKTIKNMSDIEKVGYFQNICNEKS